MFLPWLGLFEQIRLSDVFVHYDDVQMPVGRSFMSRVQIRTSNGNPWLSASIDRNKSNGNINQTFLLENSDWKKRHLNTIQHTYMKSKYFEEMYDLVKTIYRCDTDNLAQFNINAIETIAGWCGLKTLFLRSSEIGIDGKSSLRLLGICKKLNASKYITGLGALEYLDHDVFDTESISVEYMSYEKKEYPQLHDGFIPYVSIIDAIANNGSGVRDFICSGTRPWKELR